MGVEHPSTTAWPSNVNQPTPKPTKGPSPAKRLMVAQQLRNMLKQQQKGK